jgi:hypothetical protein
MYFCVPVYLSTRHCLYPAGRSEAMKQRLALGMRPDPSTVQFEKFQVDNVRGVCLFWSCCKKVRTAGTNKHWRPLPDCETAAVHGDMAAGSNNNVTTKRNNEYLTVKINSTQFHWSVNRIYGTYLPSFILRFHPASNPLSHSSPFPSTWLHFPSSLFILLLSLSSFSWLFWSCY